MGSASPEEEELELDGSMFSLRLLVEFVLWKLSPDSELNRQCVFNLTTTQIMHTNVVVVVVLIIS